ncbi:MAG: MBL fold metallo-hydrolase [Pseudonocardia sp.]
MCDRLDPGVRLTFLGHQSWLAQVDDSAVLIDPVLHAAFGHSRWAPFPVWPPRRVDVAAMPQVGAVVLSHEHLDHFHLPSLAELPRDTPILVGPLFPAAACRAVERLGFTVRRTPVAVPVDVGALRLRLLPAGAGTVVWENRVTQVELQSVDGRSPRVVVGVDALISDVLVAEHEDTGRCPDLFVASNNSQIVPPGACGATTNLLTGALSGFDRDAALGDLADGLVQRARTQLPGLRRFALCGDGFVDPRQPFGPFLLSDNRVVADFAARRYPDAEVHAPRPGETLTVGARSVALSAVSWVEPDPATERAGTARLAAFLAEPAPPGLQRLLPPSDGPAESARDLADVRDSLPYLAVSMLTSRTGKVMLGVHDSLAGSVGSERFLFRVWHGERPLDHCLDVAEGRFMQCPPAPNPLVEYPFGLEVHLEDWAGVVRGEIQVWDLAGPALRSWYLGSVYDSPIGALYQYYGEHVRPDLAATLYESVLATLAPAR